MYYGGMQAPQRSTTVPPDWLSMPPPNAWNAPSVSSVGPSFTPPQQPMRYRSLTPHGGGGSYNYGSMGPPPAPAASGMVNSMPNVSGAQGYVYSEAPVESQPAAGGEYYPPQQGQWNGGVDVNGAPMVAKPEDEYHAEQVADPNNSWQQQPPPM